MKYDPLQDGISKVEYIDHMGSDLSVVNAARVSFDKTSDWDYHGPDDAGTRLKNADAGLIKYLAKHNHWTPFGHAQLSLRIKAPIFVARQLVKHQVGLVWNEVSRRYIDTPPEFYWPKHLNARAENVKQGSTGTSHEASHEYLDAAKNLIDRAERISIINTLLGLYNDMINDGIAPEDARMFLPLNTYTEWVWSGTLAAWARVCKLRLDPHAQVHTRAFAEGIVPIAAAHFPVAFKALMEN